MLAMRQPLSLLVLLVWLMVARSVSSHTWIEQMSLIAPNGSYTAAAGYPRGYVGRTDHGFNGDSDLWLLPSLASGRTRIDGTDLLCHTAQRTPNQTPKYPKLSAAPGSGVAFKYLENGHVSLPLNQKGKPAKGGTVFVYGTTSPKADEKIMDVLQWTADGNGGDKRGRLLAAQNYDDDRCHQINGGSISVQRQKQFPDPIPGQAGTHHEQWCETDVALPKDLKTGTYTIYWVWDWPTAPGQDPTYPKGKDEIYTTCADIDVVAQAPSGPLSNLLDQQDPQTDAVKGWETRTALAKAPAALRPAGSLLLASSAPQASSATMPSAAPTSAVASAAPTPTIAGASQSLTLGFFQYIRPTPAVGSSSSPLAISSSTAISAAVTGRPAQQTEAQTLTALLTIVATLAPGQDGLVATGPFTVTFNRSPVPEPSAALTKRSAKFRV